MSGRAVVAGGDASSGCVVVLSRSLRGASQIAPATAQAPPNNSASMEPACASAHEANGAIRSHSLSRRISPSKTSQEQPSIGARDLYDFQIA